MMQFSRERAEGATVFGKDLCPQKDFCSQKGNRSGRTAIITIPIMTCSGRPTFM